MVKHQTLNGKNGSSALNLNHYEILGLQYPFPLGYGPSEAEIKAAYRQALLTHHPDKYRHSVKLHGHDHQASDSRDYASKESATLSMASAPVQEDMNTRNTGHTGKGHEQGSFHIDSIITAYTILHCPASRAEYDQHLADRRNIMSVADADIYIDTALGVESIDLDDMIYNPHSDLNPSRPDAQYHAPCRCGLDDGYRVSEDELAEAIESISVSHSKPSSDFDSTGSDEIREVEDASILLQCRGCSLRIRVEFSLC